MEKNVNLRTRKRIMELWRPWCVLICCSRCKSCTNHHLIVFHSPALRLISWMSVALSCNYKHRGPLKFISHASSIFITHKLRPPCDPQSKRAKETAAFQQTDKKCTSSILRRYLDKRLRLLNYKVRIIQKRILVIGVLRSRYEWVGRWVCDTDWIIIERLQLVRIWHSGWH